jgi:hypothetical protein
MQRMCSTWAMQFVIDSLWGRRPEDEKPHARGLDIRESAWRAAWQPELKRGAQPFPFVQPNSGLSPSRAATVLLSLPGKWLERRYRSLQTTDCGDVSIGE